MLHRYALLSLVSLASACAGPGFPDERITVYAGGDQSGRPGDSLATPLTAQAFYCSGGTCTAEAAARITWRVESGDGALLSSSPITDAHGLASATFRLGGQPGTQQVSAQVNDGVVVRFTLHCVDA